jgi:hypothetical protein
MGQQHLLFLGRQNFLNAHLIDKVLALQIGQMRSLFIVSQMCADSLGHCKDETAIIHVQPEATTDKPIVGIARERAIQLTSKVGLIKVVHARPSRGQLPNLTWRRFDISLAKASGLLPNASN